jgi:heme exporter protein D
LLLEVISPRGSSERFTLDKPDEDGLYRVITPALQFPGRHRLMLRLEGEGIEREMPVYIEVGVPMEQPTLVTRGEEPPEDDFQAPLIWLAGVSSALLLMVWYILHRRKQRKLALWQKRAREMRSNGNQATLGGAVAVDAEKEPS